MFLGGLYVEKVLFFLCFFWAVTTVDSGRKALEFLGLFEDEQPSVSPNSQQQQVSRPPRKKKNFPFIS